MSRKRQPDDAMDELSDMSIDLKKIIATLERVDAGLFQMEEELRVEQLRKFTPTEDELLTIGAVSQALGSTRVFLAACAAFRESMLDVGIN